MKKVLILMIFVLSTATLSFAQSNKEILQSINALNQQLSEQVKELQKQVAELKMLIASTDGSKLVNTGWTKMSDFYSGMARIKDDNTDLFGFIDKTGKVVIPCKWKDNYDFGSILEGLAEVVDANDLHGFIDKTGAVVIPCKWNSIGDVNEYFEGLMIVQDANGLYGFINKSGKLIIPCKYLGVIPSSFDKPVRAKRRDNVWVVIDSSGKEYSY